MNKQQIITYIEEQIFIHQSTPNPFLDDNFIFSNYNNYMKQLEENFETIKFLSNVYFSVKVNTSLTILSNSIYYKFLKNYESYMESKQYYNASPPQLLITQFSLLKNVLKNYITEDNNCQLLEYGQNVMDNYLNLFIKCKY